MPTVFGWQPDILRGYVDGVLNYPGRRRNEPELEPDSLDDCADDIGH
jgi:hypothetical protein